MLGNVLFGLDDQDPHTKDFMFIPATAAESLRGLKDDELATSLGGNHAVLAGMPKFTRGSELMTEFDKIYTNMGFQFKGDEEKLYEARLTESEAKLKLLESKT